MSATPPTIFELCDRLNHGEHVVMETTLPGTKLPVYEIHVDGFDRWIAYTQEKARAQLIARLSPDVVRQVAEFLRDSVELDQRYHAVTGPFGGSHGYTDGPRAKKANEILCLLNGLGGEGKS